MCSSYFFIIVIPKINVINTITIKMKNKVFAIEAAPAAMPPKPKIAATIAMTKKIADHFNIYVTFS